MADNEQREARRLAALRRYRVLDTPADPVFDDLAGLAAEITGSPSGLISFVDADRQWFKAVHNFPFTQSVRSISFCARAIEQPDGLIVPDATADPRFADNPLVTGEVGIRFYAGAPLVTPDGHNLGTICGIDYRPRRLDDARWEALQRLARQVMRELEVRRNLAELSATVTGHSRPESADMLQAILDRAPAAIHVKDTAGRYLFANDTFLREVGTRREQVLGATTGDVFCPKEAARLRDIDLQVLNSGRPVQTEHQQVSGAASRYHQAHVFALPDWRGSPYATCGITMEVTDRVRAEREAAAASMRAEHIVAGALDGIVATNEDGRITAFNPAAERIYGYSAAEAIGRDVGDLLIPPAHRREYRDAIAAHLRGEDNFLVGKRVEVLGRRRNGDPFPLELALVDAGADPGRIVAFLRDVSERRRADDQLRQLAEHDPPTGLANRSVFYEALRQHLELCPPESEGGSLLVLDLDAFKHINDSFGHRTGDDCLRHVADVLRERVRDGDVVARLGGDEFGVLLPGVSTHAARGVALSLLELLRQRPLVVEGRPVRVTASVGVAPLVHGVAPDDMLHTADAAMYEAKQAGRDRVAVYSDVVVQAGVSASHVGHAQHIREALVRDRFALVAQPIVDLNTGQTQRHELLVRMLDNAGMLVPPTAFLPAAERFDLVQKVDCWVVEEAVRLLRRAAEGGRPLPHLHVNLSGRSLSDHGVLERIKAAVSETDATRLVFEITETAAVTCLDAAVAFTSELTAMGCGLSLDDFGAGYASFYYLKHLPVQSVKIDGEFVRGMLTERMDRAVVRATVSLAEDMGYQTIGEYVESSELMEELRRYGVDFVQGYHVGRPQPAEEALGLAR